VEPERFFLPHIATGSGQLPVDQAHHARHVLRLKTGDTVIIFDGQGHWATAEIELVAGSGVLVHCSTVQESRRAGPQLTLATAVPKLDRADFLVEAASQLNVDVLQWLDCQRSVVRPDGQGNKIAKWRRLAVESAKQCGRNHLLRIEPMLPVEAVFKSLDRSNGMWADTRSELTLARAWDDWKKTSAGGNSPSSRGLTVFIGPEGGWSDTEVRMFQDRGAVGVRLGLNILRIEIAAIAVAAILGCG
jgi:16S rRNA (uracil1498-N3)-methyltransferase